MNIYIYLSIYLSLSLSLYSWGGHPVVYMNFTYLGKLA